MERTDITIANFKGSFPINSFQLVISKTADEPILNQEPFRTWQSIILPKELGGDKNDVSALGYTAYSNDDSNGLFINSILTN